MMKKITRMNFLFTIYSALLLFLMRNPWLLEWLWENSATDQTLNIPEARKRREKAFFSPAQTLAVSDVRCADISRLFEIPNEWRWSKKLLCIKIKQFTLHAVPSTKVFVKLQQYKSLIHLMKNVEMKVALIRKNWINLLLNVE